METLPLFSHFHEQFLERIVSQCQVIDFRQGATIINQGEPSRELYVLLEGTIDVIRENSAGEPEWKTELGAVSVFGEAALVEDTPRAARVLAKTPSTVMRVPVHVLRQVANDSQSVRHLDDFRNAILVNQFFASSPVFRSLSGESIDYLSSRGTLEYYDQNQFVFKQGDFGDSLFLILRGSVDVWVHGFPIKRLYQGSFFGEIALIAAIPPNGRDTDGRTLCLLQDFRRRFLGGAGSAHGLRYIHRDGFGSRLKEDLAVVPPPGRTGTDS
ncbi:MAG: cyclic nucleotide-binding domain-containing protein [Calothrix sp. SM1_5_4]|nr:cyclic nucleotide-binding domain-containing protein [Calothrix sp. SM1_5_4]